MEVHSTAPAGVSRFTAFVLGCVVFICVAMIGGTGYLKYQLDHAQTTLAAPDDALGGAQNVSETRLEAQHKLQFWAMLLTLVSWTSLIVASACTAGIYLVLRDRQSAPMRALAQSIENMARGDMRTAIWGVERQDAIGELARAVDVARYQFGHLPDLSLISDQGPVRLRFEGGSRSLFEAMMKSISSDSETICEQTTQLTETVAEQKAAMSAMSRKVEDILQNVAQRGYNGDQQIKQAIGEMTGSAENLKNAHAHAVDQLNRLIPHIQDRAQGLAEITQIAGKQIAQTLQSLSASEFSLKSNASSAQETLSKLSSTADNLGERLFGAINLLQAGGKVLAETTESIKTRINQGMESASAHQASLSSLADHMSEIKTGLSSLQTKFGAYITAQAEKPSEALSPEAIISPITNRFETIVTQLTSLQTKLNDHFTAQAQMPKASLSPDDILNPLTDKFGAITAQLFSLQARLAEQNAAMSHLTSLETRISELSDMNSRVALLASALPGDMRQYMREEIQALSEQAAQKESAALQAIQNAPQPVVAFPPELQKQLMDQWFQMSGQIEATRASLFKDIAQKIDSIEARIDAKSSAAPAKTGMDAATQIQLEKQAEVLTELVSTLGLIDAHMQQIKEELQLERKA